MSATTRPRRRALMRCPKCGGDGELKHQGFSLNPNSGLMTPDPQMDVSERCTRCAGTGSLAVDVAPDAGLRAA